MDCQEDGAGPERDEREEVGQVVHAPEEGALVGRNLWSCLCMYMCVYVCIYRDR